MNLQVRMLRASLAALTLVGLGGLVPRLAHAAPQIPTVVVLPVRGQEVRDRAILAAVEAQLAGLDVKVRTVWTEPHAPRLADQLARALRTAAAEGARATVWWEEAAPRGMYLHVAVTAGRRLIVREVPGAGGAELHEALAVILRSAVSALLEGVPEPVSRPRPPPRPRAPSLPPLRHGLLIGYQLEGLATEVPVTHAAHLAYRGQVHRHLALRASYQLVGPFERVIPNARSRFSPHALGLALEAFGVRGRWLLGGTVGLDLRLVHVQPLSGTGLQRDRLDPGLSATAALLGGLRLHRRVWLVLEAGARFELLGHTYVAGAPNPAMLLDPWPVHPTLLLGLLVGLR